MTRRPRSIPTVANTMPGDALVNLAVIEFGASIAQLNEPCSPRNIITAPMQIVTAVSPRGSPPQAVNMGHVLFVGTQCRGDTGRPCRSSRAWTGRRCWAARSNVGRWWPSRLVATPPADCVSKAKRPARVRHRRPIFFCTMPSYLV